MTRGKKVVELWGEPQPDDALSGAVLADQHDPQPIGDILHVIAAPEPDDQVDYVKPRQSSRFMAALLLATGIAWVGYVAVSAGPGIIHTAMRPDLIIQTISTAATPLVLLCAMWLMLRRAKVDDQTTLNTTIARLKHEQASISALISSSEMRLAEGAQAVRDQTEHLEVVGEQALNRIATLRAMLGEEIGQIGVHTNGLKNAAAAARSDMAVLLANLPKAHIETRKMVVALQDAGLTAQEQAKALIGHLGSLSERGTEAQAIAGSASEVLSSHMTQMEAQAFAMRSLVQQSQMSLAKAGDESSAQLDHNVAQITKQVDALGHSLQVQDGLSGKLLDQLRGALADVEGRLAAIDTHGTERTERLTQAIKALTEHSHVLRDALAAGGESAEALISKSEALMVSLDGSAREIDETLPAAFARLNQIARDASERVSKTATQVADIETKISTSKQKLTENDTLISDQHTRIEASHKQLAESYATATSLAEALNQCDAEMTSLSQGASVQLVEALVRVRETAVQAGERAREAIHKVIPDAAAALGDASRDAMREALSSQVESQMAHISDVALQAVDAADKATERLMRQMLTISETSAAFKAQLNSAEQAHEGAAQGTLSRRVSLLIESLNSISIDVTKILSHDVTDASWASYLRGDRGIFTRRAVKLLDAGSAREILRHYDDDDEFRDHVNRYIHDFEAMLRTVLSSRESGPLSVTLLSSDMGKLYVALAHAIERLRT